MTWREKLHAAIDGINLSGFSTPEEMAAIFVDWDDEQQAQFFIEIAKLGDTFHNGPPGLLSQAYYIGGHLKTCKCSTEEAREFVRTIASRLEEPCET